jgi:NYN domain
MRTIVYVDGFNLYYGALKGHKGTRWLDLLALSKRLLPANDIVGIAYCTAFVRPRPGNPDQLKRQKLYIAALKTIPCLRVYKGAYIPLVKRRPLASPQPGQTSQWPTAALFHDSEEKGSDVNLATRLLVEAYNGRYEAAAIISNDGDLKMPVGVVRNELGLPVTVINPHKPKKRSMALSPNPLPRNAKYIQLRHSDVVACQFPTTLTTASGKRITRPARW